MCLKCNRDIFGSTNSVFRHALCKVCHDSARFELFLKRTALWMHVSRKWNVLPDLADFGGYKMGQCLGYFFVHEGSHFRNFLRDSPSAYRYLSLTFRRCSEIVYQWRGKKLFRTRIRGIFQELRSWKSKIFFSSLRRLRLPCKRFGNKSHRCLKKRNLSWNWSISIFFVQNLEIFTEQILLAWQRSSVQRAAFWENFTPIETATKFTDSII